MRLPIRRSLAAETYSILKESIDSGAWSGALPGERTLCDRFQVSRPTLRQALKQLEKEGAISNQHGRRRLILRSEVATPEAAKGRRICFLCPTPTREQFGFTNRKIAEIEHIVHQHSIEFSLLVRPGCYTQSPAKALEVLTEENRADCWILQQTNREMQSWFERQKIPAIVTGTRHESTQLPYADIDNESVCRHAVGLLAAKRRSRIYFLTINNPYPGDLLSEAGFLAGISASASLEGRIVRHNGTRDGIRRKLDLITKAANPPDALIIDQASHAFTVVSHLLSRGLEIPKDVALICRTASRDLSFLCPSVAHYSRNTSEMAKRTAHLAVKVATGNLGTAKNIMLIPDFIPGESI